MLQTEKKDIFFDLDHTIWDFDRNAEETLHELYRTFKFDKLFNHHTADLFIETYTRNNQRLWALYHHGKIDKAELRRARFADTFEELGVDPIHFPKSFEEKYLLICPRKTNLFPYAHETLAYLQGKYNLHLISNGFKEACTTKLAESNLNQYFQTVVISEIIGINKPDPKIYNFAVGQANTRYEDAVMIGDNLDADVRGAQNAGMEAIFFNPFDAEVPSDIKYSIQSLRELQDFL